ncbi:MAG TPA: LPS assembly protein LptD [Stellaceae bacterium]|jgi:LPS-assembly protein
MVRILPTAATAAATLLLLAATASAQAPTSAQARQAPAVFTADEVRYDDELGLVVARGHVEINQNGSTVLADTVTYNQRSDTITASGHVSLLEPTGEIVFGDFVELTNRMNDAFIQNVRMLMTDRSRLAGNTGRRTNGVRTEVRRGVYSPCDLCRDDPTRPPVWQLRAAEISHDQEKKTIEYRDVTLELGGFPVLYLPYLAHPDPTVRRQSGFLPPTISNSTNLGFNVTQPYYWAIDKDKDLTFMPMFTTDAGQVAAAEYRQRWGFGQVDITGSIVDDPASDVQSSTGNPNAGDQVRGHVFGFGRFNLNDTWRSGFDVARATDQTYMRRYRFGGTEAFLTSHAFAEGFDPRAYYSANFYAFQPLVAGFGTATQPVILPVAGYSWLAPKDSLGGVWSVDGNLLNLYRETGNSTQRVSVGTGYRLPLTGPAGDLYTVSATIRGDAYNFNSFQNDVTESVPGTTDGRIFPQVALEWRYPWVRTGETFSQLIEPIAAVVAGPSGGNNQRLPNNDSNSFEFDDTQLFRPNRFSGLDRVDVGQRVDYGLHGAVYGNGGGSSSFLVGQSYRFDHNTSFPQGSGLEAQVSDVVGRVTVSPNSYLDLVYRFRLDHDDLRVRRHEATISAGPDNLRASVSYVRLPSGLVLLPNGTFAPISTTSATTSVSNSNSLDQVSLGLTLGLTQYWTLSASTTRNLRTDPSTPQTLYSRLVAVYRDECFAFVASLSQYGVTDRDIKPGTTLLFSFVFKNLGEIAAPAVQTGTAIQ